VYGTLIVVSAQPPGAPLSLVIGAVVLTAFVVARQVMALRENAGLPLGILDEQTYDETTVALEPGDLLLLYTDGITEARPPKEAGVGLRPLFGVERLDALLLDCGGRNAAECVERVTEEVGAFCGCEAPADDQTLLAIRCL
jgi:serine phosphatase RsbU (regulator of sigma subunit)